MLFLFITLCSMFDWTTAADGMFPLKSLNIIATNANCDINPCNRCEGNCADDDDCAGNLKCWKREHSHSTVPGCDTGGEAKKNYCYEPCPDGALPVNGCKKTFFSFDFTPTKALNIIATNANCTNGNCDECEGSCASDSDCAGNLKCWKRSYSHSNVPGCATGGVANENYCYKPCPNDGNKAVPYVHGCRSNLRTVLRETAGCSVTDGTIDVWVNGATAANEVYDIISSSDMRLGGQLIMGGKNIVDVGSLQATTVTTTTLDTTDLRGTGVVDENNIKNGAVTTTAIRSNAVTSATIKNGAVTEAKIGTNAVSFSKIKNGAVTEAKIDTNAVTSAKIKNGAVTPACLQNSGYFTMGRVRTEYINAGTSGWNSGWRVNLDQNVWIHHKLEVDGVAYFDSMAHFRGTGSSSMVRKVIWGYSKCTNGDCTAVNHGGDRGYAYVYSYDNSRSQSRVAADFDGYIIAKLGVMTRSDRRIKQNIVDVSDISSLNRVLKIPVRNYEYKNKLKRGYGNITGFIAQEVKEVFPEAVTLQTMGIPYIGATFKIFEMNNKIITVATLKEANATLMVGDKLNAYIHHPDDDENSHTRYRELEVLTVGESKTTLKCDECEENESANAIYIYEKIVDDFHVIDKDRIFTLHHGAIQELHKEQENLKEKVLNLENTIAQLTQRLAALDGQS